MPNNTKDLIAQALLQLAREKPVEKITVRDIVELCGVNRNTFYYHFQDIPDVAEYLMRQQVDHLISQKEKDESLSAFSMRLMDYLYAHKKTVLHIYKSLRRESFLRYLHETLLYMVLSLQDSDNLSGFTQEDVELLMFFSVCVLEGTIIEWLSSDMNEEIYGKAKKFSCLFSHPSPNLIRLLGGKNEK